MPTIYTVGPNGSLPSGGNPDYSTLQTAWDALKVGTSLFWLECYPGDCGKLSIDSDVGVNLPAASASNYIRVYAAGTARHDGTYDASGSACVEFGAGERGINSTVGHNSLNYIRFDGLTLHTASATAQDAFRWSHFNNAVIENCLIVCTGSGTIANGRGGIYLIDNTTNATVRNNLLIAPNTTNSGGIVCSGNDDAFSGTVEHNTVAGFGAGIQLGDQGGSQTHTFTSRYNVAIGAGSECFDKPAISGTTITASYNLSSDATADDEGGSGHLINQNAASVVVDTGTTAPDLKLAESSPAIGAGPTLTGFELDFLGNQRVNGAATDLGAHEYGATAMATQQPAKKNTAYVFDIGLPSRTNPATMQDSPTLAAGDVKVKKDNGALANIATLPTASGDVVTVNLSADEMNADRVLVRFKDAAGGEWCDQFVEIFTASRQIDDVTGFKLASDGLDSVSTTAPAGVASNFREMIVALWRRHFKKVTRSSTQIKTFADNGTDVLTTQSYTSSGSDDDLGAAS